eukprot:CAMPEP_0201178360 /NCGR_PEP_ID=MMETSP0851-20130426/110361_1 /ASSEMBLY_ACC=CAM_ASM_000631 /TAXON_ID=183588 /ORGANISM="Pseudo-nitzschia fraudulenta, Strain WWA7" /LENGTH=88 /DNA_ID=CAMNT_0047462123 /DNA_START=354 /DNA_END=620 /DNA_ORIENTATION=+
MGSLREFRLVLSGRSESAGGLVSLELGETWSFCVKTGSVREEIGRFLAWLMETEVVVALIVSVVLGGCGIVGIGELGELRASSLSSSE